MSDVASANHARQCNPSPHTVSRTPALLRKSRVVGALTVDVDANVTGCNAAFANMLDYSSADDVVGLSFKDELLSDSQSWLQWVAGDNEFLSVDLTLRSASGTDKCLTGDMRVRRDAAGALLGIEALLIDVSRSVPAARVEGPSRLQAIGALTSGIAHDFNNLLTVIVGNLYLLVEGVRDNEELERKAKSARDAAKRGADLTRQLLSFARQESGISATIDVAKTVRNVQKLLERALGPGIRLRCEISESVWPIRIDLAQLESALINLAVNARDAMQDGGTLVLKADNRPRAKTSESPSLPGGDYVAISVVDDGPGISDEIIERVFEPFFSTKTDRGGSGLGLSMVKRFVEDFAGAVEIESRGGHGTTVRLLLPRALPDITDATSTSLTGTRPLSTLATGHESVLVLSSDVHVRSTVHELLAVLGYSVTVVSNVQDAYAALRTVKIHLLISEALPESGTSLEDFLSGAQKMSADTKLLLMGDRSALDTAARFRTNPHVIMKPFSLTDLADSVRRVLDKPA